MEYDCMNNFPFYNIPNHIIFPFEMKQKCISGVRNNITRITIPTSATISRRKSDALHQNKSIFSLENFTK